MVGDNAALNKIEFTCSNVINDAVEENYESDHDS